MDCIYSVDCARLLLLTLFAFSYGLDRQIVQTIFFDSAKLFIVSLDWPSLWLCTDSSLFLVDPSISSTL